MSVFVFDFVLGGFLAMAVIDVVKRVAKHRFNKQEERDQ
jgi:hypothetical protein